MNQELTLYDYWRIINRRKWVALMVFAITLLSTVFYTKMQPLVYSSSAIIKIQPPNIYSKLPGSDITDFDQWGAVSTEIRVITSMEVAMRASRRLKIAEAGAEPSRIQGIASQILSAYKAERVQDSNLISIAAGSSNPYKANDIVSAVIEAYREYDLEQKSAQARKSLDDIASRKTDVEDKLRSLERQKQNFIEKNPKTGLGSIFADQLAELEIKRRELLEKYTPNHPEVINFDKRIESIQGKLAQIPAQELDLARISRELRLQEDLYATINKQYEESKLGLSSIVSFVVVVNPPFVNLTPVSPNKRLNMAIGILFGVFLAIVMVFLLENLDVSISTIEDIENFLKLPVLGIIPSVMSEHKLDNWLTGLFRKERFGTEGFRSVLLFNRKYSSSVIESYHTLRANIISNMPRKGPLSIVFSSSGAAEGKTLTAINFALAGANSGLKTLLVDADMRRPVIYQIFGMPRQPGLSDVLAKKADWRETVKESSDFIMGGLNVDHVMRFPGIENLKVLTCGTIPGNVVDLLDNSDWGRLIEDFKSEFDMVIFDTPPVLLFIDSIIISKKTDGAVLVYKAGKIARGALKRAKEQILGVNARMIGVVLNGVRASEMGPKYGYYYYDYSRYSNK
ncbi:MAG: hypothetical protein COT17_02695 [Elusimicrobia bacterium CG08_land_8_20_14_0_20_51_18]|nr:MAG: hypothetical protein COT17_02695 [Elusimicrobia bacterium CG08_land_8_20_14_0_20_51_18]